jgi:hypothetical protein
MTRTVRIGCASGFWGDSSIAAPQLVERGDIHYLVFDYLAEITMSILSRARAAKPDMGYATDFVDPVMASVLRQVKARGIRVVANAGGVNPAACRDALAKVAAAQGIALKIAIVTGDDLLARAREFAAAREMFSDAPWPKRVMSINAYLGAFPIAAALRAGADVVITGRCVDSAVALGPLIHEFGWGPQDWDKLAQGSLAGHIIECGAQATGGLFTDWHEVAWEDIGYGIVECSADGSFVVTKAAGTDGLVSFGTVAEQLVYEIGDPASYLLPDVTCDFTQVRIEEIGKDRVRVGGARGRPPSGSYKVCATYMDGWRLTALLLIGGIDAPAKARRTGDTIIARTQKMLAAANLGPYRATSVAAVGAEANYGPRSRAEGVREAVLKLSAAHDEKAALELLSKEVTAPGCSMAPGTHGFGGGRPKVQPMVRLFSFLLPQEQVTVGVDVDGRAIALPPAPAPARQPAPHVDAGPAQLPAGPTATVPLIRLAYGRSGDKGDNANIGIIARKPEYYAAIRRALTPEAVRAWFAHLVEGKVERFDLPGISGVNFLLHNALGGGGTTSLRVDVQAKAYAQQLMDFPVEVPAAWGLQRDAA